MKAKRRSSLNIDQKVDARSAPAKVTTDDESALTSKGYVKIGRIKATQPGNKTGAEVTEGLRAAALSKAAGAGGDVVRFTREGGVDTTNVPGKMRRVCAQEQQAWAGAASHQDCYTDIHGFQHCNTVSDGSKYITTCVRWESVATTKLVKSAVSEGTVWRYDPNLPAEIARAEAAREDAAREAAKEAYRKEDAAREAAKEAYRKEEAAREEASRKAEADEIAFRPWKSLNFEAKDGSPRKEAELLLAHGADVNAKDEHGRTPLYKAADDDNKELTALLLAHGADVNAKDDIGYTPLHCASYKDESELLLTHGADANAKDKEGKTPLHKAASADPEDYKGLGKEVIKFLTERNLARIEVLLDHGADVNAKDNDGQTPLFYAKIGAIAKLLRAQGGQK